jgi:hypothetical protein
MYDIGQPSKYPSPPKDWNGMVLPLPRTHLDAEKGTTARNGLKKRNEMTGLHHASAQSSIIAIPQLLGA